ncbi:MAG: hypothetical protein ACP5T4_02415, partial [Candidatus Micrarchaeia archaeon]
LNPLFYLLRKKPQISADKKEQLKELFSQLSNSDALEYVRSRSQAYVQKLYNVDISGLYSTLDSELVPMPQLYGDWRPSGSVIIVETQRNREIAKNIINMIMNAL